MRLDFTRKDIRFTGVTPSGWYTLAAHRWYISVRLLTVLEQAYQAHPERFVRGQPQPTKLPEAVWINPPPIPAALSAPAPQTASTKVAAAPGTGQLAASTTLRYTDIRGPEDRATLRSDPSAVPADGVAGQGGYQVFPAHTSPFPGATLSSKR